MPEKKSPTMDQIVSLCKRRGFVFQGSDIYGGFGNTYSYGPYGSQMKKNIKDLWWKMFVESREDIVGIDGDIFMHPRAWEASGHASGFNDQMVDCKDCKARIRADHLVEDALKIDCEGKSDEEVTKIIQENSLKCPKCGSDNLTDARKFNLMFKAPLSKTGGDDFVYLRPETAQAIFLEFKNTIDNTRVKVPFGIAQIGKAFRNEITPGNFIFRQLEFEQMEIEYFFMPPKNWAEKKEELMSKGHIDEWDEETRKPVEDLFDQWEKDMTEWCDAIGLESERCHVIEHAPEKLSHYSKRTFDIEFDFPFGQKELYGCAYRTDFDLSQHEKFSGKTLKYRDPQTNEEYIPHVLEPTFGLGRSFLAILTSSYEEEQLEDGTSRTVLHLKPAIAPVKIAVLPLMKKDGLAEKAKEIQEKLKIFGTSEYDDGGKIGKRYRRQDEIGTPVCITIDYDSMENDTVTIRDRDSMEQEVVKVDDLVGILAERYFG
jgi:glycyl-tRNA synthetase